MEALRESREDTPVQLLIGARQTGKSTLALQIAGEEDIPYRTLDDATVLSAAAADPEGFLRGLGERAVIDEVQRVPELLLAIKNLVDEHRAPGRYLLTGSSHVMTLPRVSDSLAGRVELHILRPLSQGELEDRSERFIDAIYENIPDIEAAGDRKELNGRIVRGGYPEAVSRSRFSRRKAWFDSYVSTVLSRDVRDIANIEHLASLPRLLSLTAARSAGLLNFSELSNSSSLPQSTLKRYLGILETLFLLEPLPAWSSNRGKRLIRSPKLFLADTGLAVSLLGIDGENLNGNDLFYGTLLEAFVLNELRKQRAWSSVKPNLFHYRNASGKEVDVVCEAPDGRLVGIEVKGKASVRSEDFKGLRSFEADAGKSFLRGILLYNGTQNVQFSDTMAAVPIPAIWQA